jgi:acid stress chaperone HdeB
MVRHLSRRTDDERPAARHRETVSVMTLLSDYHAESRRAFMAVSATIVAGWNLPAKALVVLEMSMITSRQYMGQDRKTQDTIAAWMSGYFNAANGVNMLNVARFRRNRKAAVISAIQRNAQ